MIGQRMVVAGVIGAIAILAGTAGPAAAQPAPAETPAPRVAAVKAGATKAGPVKGRAAKEAKGAKPDKPDKPAAPPAAWMSVDPDRATRPDAAEQPAAAPGHKAVVSHIPSGDPVEIGGKWNGSNESSAQTRAQNYNGDAEGTGGSVGLKLHF